MRDRSRRWAWLWLPISFWVVCVGWALTSPPGSSPDDDYHLSSIWCASGLKEGVCQEVPEEPGQRLVPRNVVEASYCFRFERDVDAGCTADVRDDSTMVPTDRVNEVAGLYPTGYYRAMNLLVGPDVERSVVTMRLVNAGLVALLLALLLRTVPTGIRTATVVAMTATFIPLGLFVVASTNPSGWASAGVLLFWGFAVALLHRADWRNRRTWLIAVGAVLTAGMAISSRVDSSAYLALAALLALAVAWRPGDRSRRVSALAVIALGLMGVVAYLLHPTPGGTEGVTMGSTERGGGLLLTNLVYLPVLVQGIVGGGQLGWNDTVMPPAVPIVGVLVLGGFVWTGLSVLWARKASATAIAFVALVAAPLWFLQKEGLGVGEVVQPRYLLPLLGLLVGTLLLGPRPQRPIALPATPLVVSALALAGTAALAFWSNTHRYAAGSTVGLFDPGMTPAWDAGVPLWFTTGVTLLATLTWVGGSLLVVARPQPGFAATASNGS